LDEDAEHLENTRPTPVAPVSPDATGHVWHEKVFSSMKLKVCMNCGFLLNEDQPNKPCPGPVSVGLRAEDATGKCGELVTVAQAHFDEFGEFDDIAWIKGYHPHPECIQLVTRSQAEELLARKDYLLSVSDTVAAQLQNKIVTLTLQKEALETDNAAKDERIDRLVDDYANLVKETVDQKEQIADLEDRLAAAEQFIQFCADGFFVTDDELRGAARAALGGKP